MTEDDVPLNLNRDTIMDKDEFDRICNAGDYSRAVGRDNNRLTLPECYGLDFGVTKFQQICNLICVHGASGSGGCKAMQTFIDNKFRQPKAGD